MFLFCYYSKGTMIGSAHKANDDCALCKAWTKKQAFNKFKKLYASADTTEVFRVRYNDFGVAILSDY